MHWKFRAFHLIQKIRAYTSTIIPNPLTLALTCTLSCFDDTKRASLVDLASLKRILSMQNKKRDFLNVISNYR